MFLLALGLVLFLGSHSVRIVADDWRTRTIARIGPMAWKGLYSLVSLLGLALIIWGWSQARMQPWFLWSPPLGLKHLNSLLTLAAFILLVAAYVPRNAIKSRLRHPMILGVKLWAFGHLLSTGTAANALLFGAFLIWAVFDFRAARQRDRAQGAAASPGGLVGTLLTLIVGVLAWAAFAFWLHAAWIGIAPLGR